jgi:hypothetical protein
MKIWTAIVLVSALFTTGCSFSIGAGRPTGYRTNARTNYVAAHPQYGPQARGHANRRDFDPRSRGSRDGRCGLSVRMVSVEELHRRGNLGATEPKTELANVCR